MVRRCDPVLQLLEVIKVNSHSIFQALGRPSGGGIRLVHRGIHRDRSNKQYDFGGRPSLFQLPEFLSEWL
jgi:hypothetical protein